MSVKAKQCHECGSKDINHNSEYGFYHCQSCGDIWSYAEDDPDYDECAEEVDYGECCACGATGPTVRNFIGLERKSLAPGKGWGCVVCQLPTDGALAILCDSCLDAERDPTQAIDGYASQKKRVPIDALTEEFKHKDVPH